MQTGSRSNTETVTDSSSTASGTSDLRYDPEWLKGKLVDVWPYYEPVYPADTFVQMWNAMIEDNTLSRVFFEHGQMTFPELVRFFDHKANPARLLLIYTDKAGAGAGFGWFDDVRQGIRAFANICMRKAHWGPVADEACRISLRYIFTAHDVPTVYGFTPAPNRMAIAQAKRLGFKVLVTVPKMISWKGQPGDVVMTMLRREDFLGER